MASVKPSVRVVKSFAFKGGTREWSNRYFFSGGVPSTTGHWETLFDAIVLREKAALGSQVTIVRCDALLAGSDVVHHSKVYSTTGTFTPTANSNQFSGETAGLTRYSTAARSTKNHPIYIMKYYHGVFSDQLAGYDDLESTQRTALETYAGYWLSGFSDGGGVTAVLSSPAGHDATGHETAQYVTHRDFPYTPST